MAIMTLPLGTQRANTPRLPKHIRSAITAELAMLFDRVDVLISRLDADDGDVDLEEDDYGGTDLDRGEADDDDARGLLPTRPLYAVDQTAGPINYAEAQSAYLAAENGLVRLPSGGWRRAA